MLPEGYTLLAVEEDSILVGVGFQHFGRHCPDSVIYETQIYDRGYIEICNNNNFCSIRRFDKRRTYGS